MFCILLEQTVKLQQVDVYVCVCVFSYLFVSNPKKLHY